ncbi:MAG: 3-deoxy-7-phosphoheptulonate synthase [Planctomycetota bacterium]|nr:3-deoxy-7-phosphoheptulonate synthase [Planctomycetota bacterium]
MLVVMRSGATEEEVERVARTIRRMGFTPHVIPGANRTAIGITGNSGPVDPHPLEGLPGVAQLIPVTKPYKLVSREFHPRPTEVGVGRAVFGDGSFQVIAGPCAVEDEAGTLRTAEYLASLGVRAFRAGAYKPRTSPYAFQGLREEGLKILESVREKFGMAIVTEVIDVETLPAVEECADMLQIGARNMQNFSLLRRAGKSSRPILLKRGMSATLEEWLLSAEYILNEGNPNVVLCERGVRTFADHTRNTLDLSVIPTVKTISHLPVIADPSHGTGRRAYVPPMSKAALACGADGLLVEVHHDPDNAISDGAQSLSLQDFKTLYEELRHLSEALGRKM